MHKITQRHLGICYWIILISFAILEPWGSIDTRDFSYLSDYKFWGYNTFIMYQLIGMLILSIILWRNKAKLATLLWITSINSTFIVMNLFDIVHFFPDPAQPLPFLVLLIEVLTSTAAFGIILIAAKTINTHDRTA